MNASKRVLVVDDERTNRNLLRAMLKSFGHDPVVACNGIEALDKAELGFDLILLDVMMPGIDGFETARRFRDARDFSDIPIMMVTAFEDKETRLRAVQAGANDFISKPIDKVELEIRSTALLKRKEMRDALKRNFSQLKMAVEQRGSALRDAHHELSRTREEVLELETQALSRLTRAAECRDGDTGTHIRRTRFLSALLANRLGFSPDEVRTIYHAAPLHDVGKIGVPDRILLKEGKLTDAEWEIMKSHTTKGAEMLSDSSSPVFAVAREIALCHHERWDGMGYPHGISGTQIPFPARIVAVADTFDAITSPRPYQPARSSDEAFEIIRDERGRQFDPSVVDTLLMHRNAVEALRRHWGYYSG